MRYKAVCVGGPRDGETVQWYMKMEGIFIFGIPNLREPKMLGWYNLSDDESQYVWEHQESDFSLSQVQEKFSDDDRFVEDRIHNLLWTLYPRNETLMQEYKEDADSANIATMIVLSLKRSGVMFTRRDKKDIQ